MQIKSKGQLRFCSNLLEDSKNRRGEACHPRPIHKSQSDQRAWQASPLPNYHATDSKPVPCFTTTDSAQYPAKASHCLIRSVELYPINHVAALFLIRDQACLTKNSQMVRRCWLRQANTLCNLRYITGNFATWLGW